MTEQRKLATIMAVDVAGYSRAAERDEAAATDAVRQLRAAIDAILGPLSGRVFNTAGDGFMIELPTASAGVEAARQLLAAPGAPPARIGLHLGEVIVADNGDLLGHGVNVAARLQQMAEPGTALMSQAVQAQIHSSQVKLAPLGKVQLDKMHERIDVFALALDHKKPSFRRVSWRRARRALAAMLVLGVLGVGAYTAWRIYGPQQVAETPRLAILRFETVGETEPHFVETVADELITNMARLEGLEIIARSSSFALDGERATPQGAAQDLNANLVLTGSVRRMPETVRVVAHLIEAPGGRQMWTAEFERPLSEIYLLQNEIAARVATAVGLRAAPSSVRRVDPQAYDLYLRGRENLERDPDAAAASFEQAVAREPDFAAAWAQLARARMRLATSRWIHSPPGVPLDPAWQASGFEAAARAIALDPTSPVPYQTQSVAYSATGHWREALAAANETAARGGQSVVIYQTLGYLQRAAQSTRHLTQSDPLNAGVWVLLADICRAQRDFDCSIPASQRAIRLGQEIEAFSLALTLDRAGRTAEALNLVNTHERALREMLDDPSAAPLSFAMLRAMLGQGEVPATADLLATLQSGAYPDNLIDIFIQTNRGAETALLLPHWTPAARPSLTYLYDYSLAPMRARPEFWALMEREGIVDVWCEVGPPDFCETEPVCEAHLLR